MSGAMANDALRAQIAPKNSNIFQHLAASHIKNKAMVWIKLKNGYIPATINKLL